MRYLSLGLLLLAACGDDPSTVTDRSPVSASDAGASDAGASDASAEAADAARPLGDICDPHAPACPKGEKCVATRWNLSEPWPAPRCVPELGAAGQSEKGSCFAVSGHADGCGTGMACTNFGTGEGYCHITCGTGEACGASDVCATVDDLSGFALCMQACEDDDDCGAPGWKSCVERAGVKFCEGARMND